jgi:formate transporter
MSNGVVEETMVQIVSNKIALDPVSALARGILCNVLVCLAVGCAWERGV